MKLFSTCFFTFIFAIAFTACNNNAKDFTVSGASELTITGYTGFEKDLAIPAKISGKPVTAIEDEAFQEKKLTGIIIPENVKSIGNSAFYGNRLTVVSIPDSVVNIGVFAFSENRLTSVKIGNSVALIGERAFSKNQLTSVTIPDSVINIGPGAFYGNLLTNVKIGNGVKLIEEWAFFDSRLTDVTIGANVTIDSSSFGESFMDAYDGNGKKAGTYKKEESTGAWSYSQEKQ